MTISSQKGNTQNGDMPTARSAKPGKRFRVLAWEDFDFTDYRAQPFVS